jgi:DNA-binding GntR family transcriptional regulator
VAAALASGDVQKADEAMRQHVNFGFPSIVQGLQPPGQRRWRLAAK